MTDNQETRKVALVTGAGGGLGRETAVQWHAAVVASPCSIMPRGGRDGGF